MRYAVLIGSIGFCLAISVAHAGEASELERLRGEYADVLALSGSARAEILALARILRERPAMAIDFTHASAPTHCFNTGGDMLHIADTPDARIPLAYFHPAQPLVEAGLDVGKLPVQGDTVESLEPDRWYYYPGGGRTEPFHGKALPAPMLIRTVGMP